MSFAPERIKGWRTSQLSIARHYGGIVYNGKRYDICPLTDDLVREDVLRAERKAAAKPKHTPPTLDL